MTKQKKIISVLTAAALLCTGIGTAGISQPLTASAADSIESSMDWDTLNIAGGGFVPVSSPVTIRCMPVPT